MNESGKSDKPVVPGKPAKAPATESFWELFARTERVEGRGAWPRRTGRLRLPSGTRSGTQTSTASSPQSIQQNRLIGP
jgi:hypothetical protein